jgi:hypothetical protein
VPGRGPARDEEREISKRALNGRHQRDNQYVNLDHDLDARVRGSVLHGVLHGVLRALRACLKVPVPDAGRRAALLTALLVKLGMPPPEAR